MSVELTKARLWEFFQLLYGSEKGWIDLRYVTEEEDPEITDRVRLEWPTFEQHKDFPNPKWFPKDKHVINGVLLRRENMGKGFGIKANCQESNLLWVDVDMKDHPEYTHGQEDLKRIPVDELNGYKAEALADLLDKLDKEGFPPRVVVDSGHGLHFYFARKLATNHEDTVRFNRRLAHFMGGELSGVNNIQATLRLPCSLNVKNSSRALIVKIAHEDADAFLDDRKLEDLPDPPEDKPKKAAKSKKMQKFDDQISAREKYARNALTEECDQIANHPEGGRNNQLNQSAFSIGTLVGAGVLPEDYARQSLEGAAEHAGLEIGEIQNTINSALAAGMAKPRDLGNVGTMSKDRDNVINGSDVKEGKPPKKKSPPPQQDQATTKEMAECGLLEMKKSGIYKYHNEWQSWWVYKNGVYEEQTDEDIKLKVYADLIKHDIWPTRNQVGNVIGILESFANKKGMKDQTDYELNFKNGIINLEKERGDEGYFRDHSEDWFSTAQGTAIYDPEAVSHDWLKFLRESVPKEKNRLILQQFAGLCLTADSRTQKSLMLIGEGGTGKGTFMDVLNAVLGELSTSSSIEQLKDGSFSIGTLVGKRLCIVSELPNMFCWMTFKRIVGEDRVKVDVKHKTPFLAKFGAKIIMLANNTPSFGEDSANNSLSRRIIPIKWDNISRNPDPFLRDRLTEERSLSGVLNWMIEGLEMLRANGMRFPDQSKDELMQEMVEESNKVITFLDHCCEVKKDGTESGIDLYTAYKSWARQNGYLPVGNNKFVKQLLSAAKVRDVELSKKRKSKGVEWTGLVLDADWRPERLG